MQRFEPDGGGGSTIAITSYFVILALMLAIGLWMIAPYLLAIFSGGFLALLFFRPYKYLMARKFNRHVAALFIAFAATLIIIGPLIGLGYIATSQVVSIGKNISEQQDLSLHRLLKSLAEWEPARRFITDPQQLQKNINTAIQNLGNLASTTAVSVLQKIPDYALQLGLFILAFYFLLLDGEKFLIWFKNKIPIETALRDRLYTVFKDSAISSVWASLAAATSQTLLTLLVFLVLRIPMAALATATTFLLSWIPIVGSSPVWVVGAIYLYWSGSTGKVVLMLLFGVGIGLVDNLVRSLVLHGRDNTHPLVSLVAIFGAIRLFGIVGIFFGPILAALLMSLLQILPIFVSARRRTPHS